MSYDEQRAGAICGRCGRRRIVDSRCLCQDAKNLTAPMWEVNPTGPIRIAPKIDPIRIAPKIDPIRIAPKIDPIRIAPKIDPTWADGSHMRTVSGRRFSLSAPRATDVLFSDIAYALSRIPRFNGHTRSADPLSVAQHSVAVMHSVYALSDVAGEGRLALGLAALMHDAHEAYLGDITTPAARAILKASGVDYNPIRDVKERVQAAIVAGLGLAVPTREQHAIIKQADALQLERELQMYLRGTHPCSAWSATLAERVFTRAFTTLTGAQELPSMVVM